MTFDNTIKLIKSVFNTDKNNYYHNIYVEKDSYELPKKISFCINKMRHYDRIDISEGIDVNMPSKSKECDIFHYSYFLNKGFKFHRNVYNKCHDLLMTSMDLSDIPILIIKSADYCCIISRSNKREIINLMQTIDLTEKRGTL